MFNVKFLDNPDNVVSLYRSKALGEPPLLLGISVWAAVKNALSYVGGKRQIPKLENVLKETLRLHPPLIILMRVAKGEFEVEGFPIHEGDLVAVVRPLGEHAG